VGSHVGHPEYLKQLFEWHEKLSLAGMVVGEKKHATWLAAVIITFRRIAS
jgi:hypothetical protein